MVNICFQHSIYDADFYPVKYNILFTLIKIIIINEEIADMKYYVFNRNLKQIFAKILFPPEITIERFIPSDENNIFEVICVNWRKITYFRYGKKGRYICHYSLLIVELNV